jgi:quercetin dioxygenase-like cupin family protein
MKKRNLSEFWRGWFIGNFEPSLFKTNEFEVGVLTHLKDEIWGKHFHKLATEFNVLLKGEMELCGELINEGEIFILEPGEVADPVFKTDCVILCIKTPSIPGDKYEVLQSQK